MADKGTNQQRRPTEAAVSKTDQQREEGLDPAQAGLHDAVVDTRGASPGAVAPRPRGGHQEEGRETSSESGTAEFFQRLTDFAESHTEDEGDLDLEGGEEDQLGLEGPVASTSGQERRVVKPNRGSGGTRSAAKELGGEAEPDEPEARPAVAPQTSGTKASARVRPKKRAATIELEELLDLGVAEGLIEAYQRSCVFDVLVQLTWDDFDELQGALDLCESQIQQIVVLAALAAHRSVAWLADFAAELAEKGDEVILKRCSYLHGGSKPGEDCSIDAIRHWYDPMTQFDISVASEPVDESADVWALPKWLRGVPRPALDMAALAFDQCLRSEFHPEQERAEGANDLLTRALHVHGLAHPALERWLLSLCARTHSRSGLVSARNALLEARNQVAAAD